MYKIQRLKKHKVDHSSANVAILNQAYKGLSWMHLDHGFKIWKIDEYCLNCIRQWQDKTDFHFVADRFLFIQGMELRTIGPTILYCSLAIIKTFGKSD